MTRLRLQGLLRGPRPCLGDWLSPWGHSCPGLGLGSVVPPKLCSSRQEAAGCKERGEGSSRSGAGGGATGLSLGE